MDQQTREERVKKVLGDFGIEFPKDGKLKPGIKGDNLLKDILHAVDDEKFFNETANNIVKSQNLGLIEAMNLLKEKTGEGQQKCYHAMKERYEKK